MSQQLTNDQFYQRFGNLRGWAAGWGVWRIKTDNTPSGGRDWWQPKILQMVKLDVINNKTIAQDTMFGTHVGHNPVRSPCSGDSGKIFH